MVMTSVDPKATFWRTSASDSQALPTILDLEAAGFAGGDVLELTYEVPAPGFSLFGCSGPFESVEAFQLLVGVFSGSHTLLPTSVTDRVPEAIDTGSDFVSRPAHFGQEPTDIPEDFLIFPARGYAIKIPPGATHLFLGVDDIVFRDNCGTINVTLGANYDGSAITLRKSGLKSIQF